jgi:CHASE2 domain-containing sensor protein
VKELNFKVAILTYKALHQQAPDYLKTMAIGLWTVTASVVTEAPRKVNLFLLHGIQFSMESGLSIVLHLKSGTVCRFILDSKITLLRLLRN